MAYLEMHLEAAIVRTWRPRSCELGGRKHASYEMHSEAVIERVWRCTWKAAIVQTGRP